MSRERLKAGLGLLLGAAALLVLAVPAVAQVQGTVTVSVTDMTNDQPLNGARVVLVGTNHTGVTDGRGHLTLTDVPANAYTIRVLAIGYRSEEQNVTVNVGGTAAVAFTMSLSGFTLDEIVVTGTGGAVSKKKIGTSLGTVDVAAQREVVPVHDFGSVLQGHIPSVRSVSMGGGLGSAKDLRVRGVSSFSLGQRPVVYIDGIKIDTRATNWGTGGTTCCGFSGYAGNDRLGDLNPDDIERVEVLKGAAATTLYGTEATNGVIQIFTKKGRNNSAPRWNLNYSGGFNRLRANMPTKTYPDWTGPDGFRARDSNELIENGIIQQGNVGVQGGGETVTYFIDAGLLYEEGSIKPNDMTRGNVRLNLNWTASDKWSFELTSAYTNNSAQLVQAGNNWTALLGNAILGNPQTATEERQFGEPWVSVTDAALITSSSAVNRWTGGATINYQPTQSFAHRLTFGLDAVTDRRERLHPFGHQYIYVGDDGERSVAYRNNHTYTLDYLGTLNLNLSDDFISDFSFGAQGFWETDLNNTAIGEGFAGEGVTTVSGAAVRSGREGFREEINLGIFAQNRFSLWDKLFATVGFRLDGNSAFGDEFGFQFYPKSELSYMISEEGFLPTAIAELKLRGAIGMSGLAPGAFDQFRTFTPLAVMEGMNGVQPDNPGNANLEPEKTIEYEGGFDMALFNGRVALEATGYYAKTTDALLDVPLPPSQGFPDDKLDNVGEVENRGWEAKIDMTMIETGNARWATGFSIDYNRNKVLDLGPAAECNDIGDVDQHQQGAECRLGNHRLGRAIGANFARVIDSTEFAGGWDAANETHIRTDTSEYIGDPLPHWTGSMTQSLEFGAFRVYGMVTFETGAWFSNGDRAYQFRQGGGDEYLALLDANGDDTFSSDSMLNFYTLIGARDQRDNIRLTEVSVSYQLPQSLCSVFGLGRTSVSLSGQNLMWWDDCNCRDPNGAWRAGATNVTGGDFLSMPSPRKFLFTLRTTF
jgi:TonB-dependent SusC/RagA subfamily outer membrane receptor